MVSSQKMQTSEDRSEGDSSIVDLDKDVTLAGAATMGAHKGVEFGANYLMRRNPVTRRFAQITTARLLVPVWKLGLRAQVKI